MISGHNATSEAGIRGLQRLVMQRIAMTGFIVHDHVHKLADCQRRLAPWIAAGERVLHEDVVHGLERAPSAFLGMLKGEAIGKRLVQVADA